MLIPSIYSTILMLGAELYRVSLPVLLLPFCIVIGIILYRTYVYRPAKDAHDKRKDVLRKRQVNGNFSSSDKQIQNAQRCSAAKQARVSHSFGFYVAKAFNIFKIGFLSGITNFSDRKLKKHLAKKGAFQQKWCVMNVPLHYQGPDRHVEYDESLIHNHAILCKKRLIYVKSGGKIAIF